MIKKRICQHISSYYPSEILIVKLITPAIVLLITSCASTPQYSKSESGSKNENESTQITVESSESSTTELPASNKKQQHTTPPKYGGGYYLDDGPGDNPPNDLHLIPDAMPKLEPLRKSSMRPYKAMGRTFKPMTSLKPYKVRGIASWYGRRYHGNKTASGETYDMYAMTAAHPILPLPSYARVTSVNNGKTVIVRINDRGPFLSDRLIDLSYTAAYKLDIISNGSGEVIVELLLPEQIKQFSQPTPTVQHSNHQEDANASYLQLAAFTTANSASDYLSHIQERLPWPDNAITIVEQNGLFKIHAGPYADPVLAQRAANAITQPLAINPLIITD